MKRNSQIVAASLLLAAAALVYAAAGAAQQPIAPPQAALNDAQVRALVQRAIALQHRSDDALDVYDRTEHTVDREDEKTKESTSRLVPVGASEVRVDLKRDGKPVPPVEIKQKWAYVLSVMEQRTHTGDPDVKKEYQKAARRKTDGAKMVDAIGDAFIFHWAGRDLRAGRPAIELNYEPNPAFKSNLRFSGIYKQIYGKVWLDEGSGYVVRLEAELRKDIPIGGGIVGKIYKGARIEVEQAEAAPGAGVWLPTFTSFDVEFRKFLFGDSLHRKQYAGDYRRIGPPAEALALLRDERAQVLAPREPLR